jgi:hypothetical protein
MTMNYFLKFRLYFSAFIYDHITTRMKFTAGREVERVRNLSWYGFKA